MKYLEVEVQLHAFLTSALDGLEWLASRRGRFNPGERLPVTVSVWGCVGPRAGLNAVVLNKSRITPAANWTFVVQPVT
jgi:hypothetical protein